MTQPLPFSGGADQSLPASLGARGWESTGQRRRCGSDPWVEKISWRKKCHPSILAWRIPWTEEPGGLPSVGSQSQTRLTNYAPALVRECSARACSPSPSERLQRNPPTGRCIQPLLPSSTRPPGGQRCSLPSAASTTPLWMQSVCLRSSRRPRLWMTQKQQPSVPVKQSSPGGDMAFVQHPSPLPQGLPYVGASPGTGLVSLPGHFRPSGPWLRCSTR